MKKHTPALILCILLFCVTGMFVVIAYISGLLPMQLLISGAAALVCLDLLSVVLAWNVRRKAFFAWGTVLALLLMAVITVGSLGIGKLLGTAGNIMNVEVVSTKVGVYVRADDNAQSVSDTKGYSFGVLESIDRVNTDKAISKLSADIGSSPKLGAYASPADLVTALLDGEVDGVVLNSAYFDLLGDLDGFLDLDSRIRMLGDARIDTIVQKTEKNDGEVFTVFISGIDTRGPMIDNSRSDSNIIATVNTKTHQVLLLSTPRDYFVPLSISNGAKDKLTHAGIYGVSCCMDTLGMLYDIDIDYYFRVNFAGFENIIDSLGGITVHSDYTFTSRGCSFVKGENNVNGEQALVFARERYSFPDGDRQRGKDQMEVIKAVAKKALSYDMLMNFSGVLDSMEGSFETSVPYELLASLVRSQLSTGGDWNFVSYSVNGYDDSQKPYSMGGLYAYVMQPDYDSVETAKQLMQQVRNGETIQLPE